MRNLFFSIAIHCVLIAGAFVAARGFDPRLASPHGAIEVGAVGSRARAADVAHTTDAGDNSALTSDAGAGSAPTSNVRVPRVLGGNSATTSVAVAGPAPSADDLASVSARIERNLEYPLSLRRLGVAGETRIRMRIAADGSLSSLEVAQSSGQITLDELAISAVRRSAPFESSLAGRPFELPIRFRIRQR